MDKQEKIITVATVALLVLAVVVAVLVWGGYSNWFTTDFEYIYLKAGGERLQQNEVYVLGNTQLDVKQFGGKHGYSVKVTAASNEDFVFTVDGKYCSYLEEVSDKDLTDIFDIDTDKSNFMLHARNLSPIVMLQKLYPGHEVALIGEPVPVLYKLTVTDAAEKHSFELTFRCNSPVTDVELDPDHVYVNFGGEVCATSF